MKRRVSAALVLVGLTVGCGGSPSAPTSPSNTPDVLVYHFTGQISLVTRATWVAEPAVESRFRVGDPFRMTVRIGDAPTTQPATGSPGVQYMPVSGTATFGDYTVDADPGAANYVIVRNDSPVSAFGPSDQLLASFAGFAPAAPPVGTLTLDFVSLNLLGPSDLWSTDQLPRSLPSIFSFRHFNQVSLSFRDARGVKFSAEVGATITSATVTR